MDHFELVSEYQPTGDQPQAIEQLVHMVVPVAAGLQGDRHGGNCDDPVFRFRKYPRNGMDIMGCGGIYHIPGMLREALR